MSNETPYINLGDAPIDSIGYVEGYGWLEVVGHNADGTVEVCPISDGDPRLQRLKAEEN